MLNRLRTAMLLAMVPALIPGSGAMAQATDTVPARTRSVAADSLRVLVEYVGGANLYLAAGSEAGLEANDTVDARGARGTSAGKLRVISSTEGRSVVAFVGAPFPVTRGDSLTVLHPGARLAAASGVADPENADTTAARRTNAGIARTEAAPPTRRGAQPARQVRRPSTSQPRLDGSLAFDLDATSSRADDGSGGSADPWRFVTPTVRLHASASGLPGGARMMVNASWAQFYANGNLGPGRTDHVRIYQAEIEKAFDGAPIQVRAGRFYDRHDMWGGYLDGGSLRLGGTGNGPGIGVSAGLTPIGAEQTLFSGGNRLSAFADYRHRTGSFGYDMDVAFTRRTWSGAPADRYVGLTQRFRFGSASLYQRSRVDFDPATGSPDLTQFDLTSSLPLGSGWMVRGQYSLRSFDWISGAGVTAVQSRTRAGGGISWSGGAGSLSLDAQLMKWGDRPRSPVYSGSIYLPRLFGPVGLSANASINRDPSIQSSYVSPGLLLQAGSLRAEASWRLYQTNTATYDSETTGTSFSLSFPLRRGLQAMIRGDLQNGTGSSSQRLYTGLWAAF